MNSASKILTVSYGTFSCTLEGFDDPFNTMKAIAEYFRDLAAGDRYFGAEPPQPDAAMLHKIAEREIQRRVEAKVQENGVILRAEDTGTADTHAPAPETAEASPPVVRMPVRGTPPAPRPAPTLAAPELADQPGTGPAAESVAEKLSRLRKAAADSRAAAPAATVMTLAGVEEDRTEDQPIVAPLAPTALFDVEEAEPATEVPAFDDILPEDALAADAQILTGDLLPEDQSLDADEDLAADAAVRRDAEDWVDEDDLADLMALDAAAHQTTGPQHVAADDLPQVTSASDDAQVSADVPDVADADTFDDEIFASLIAEPAAPVLTPDTAEDASGLAEQDADDALLASLGTLVGSQEVPAGAQPDVAPIAAAAPQDNETAASGFATADEAYDDEADAAAALVGAEFEADYAEAFDDGTDEAMLQPLTDTAAADNGSHSEAAAQAVTAAAVVPVRPVRPMRPTAVERPAVPELAAESGVDSEFEARTPVTVEKLQRARARVIKIRRNEAADTAALATPPRAGLSQEAESALAAELAALEQDAPEQTAVRKSDAGAAGHRLDRPTEEVAVSRLMAEASTQMEVPDTKRRRSAIAHLKAAVAATIAERRATGSTLAENGRARMGAYRDDLAKVMRPSAAPSAPQGERPAPLVLVSEQRIDRPAEVSRPPVTAVQPVRPRRPMSSAAVAMQAEAEDAYEIEEDAGNIFEGESGFPEFAEQLGATDLPDLLEAAAAYIACVQGLDSFTRPQLMRHIGAAAEGISREDGLRSFGILLREGVIERSRRGQFALSDASPLLAQARKIAG